MGGFPTIPTKSVALEYDRTAAGKEVSTAVAELPDGVTIRLRIAPHFALVAELEHVERDLTILAHPTSSATTLEQTEPRIERPETWSSQWEYDFYGVIEETENDPVHSDDDFFYILDVGIGSIYVHSSLNNLIPDSDVPLQRNDALYVPASPIEVWELTP